MVNTGLAQTRVWLIRLIRLATWVIILFVLAPLSLHLLAPRGSAPFRMASAHSRALGALIGLPKWTLGRDAQCPLGAVLRRVASERLGAYASAVDRSSAVLATGNGYVQLRTARGDYWVPEGDEAMLAETVEEQDEAVYEQGTVRIRHGDIVLDCGANVGVSVRSALARGAALVVAIEPAPGPLECLRRNLTPEIREGRVIVYPKGVWDKEAELEMSVDPRAPSTVASVMISRGAAFKIPVTTIDQIVTELKLARVDFIKMDIEGAEAAALKGATNTIATFHPRMAIALEHNPTDPAELGGMVPRLWPGYEAECGPCALIEGHVQPMILFARFASGD